MPVKIRPGGVLEDAVLEDAVLEDAVLEPAKFTYCHHSTARQG